MIFQIGDMITQGLDLYRDNGDLIGTVYSDGEFWPAFRPCPETQNPHTTLYTEDLEKVIYTLNNFNQIYHDTANRKQSA